MEHLSDSLRLKIRHIEEEEILQALKSAGWVKARAARMLGITERMIGYKVKKYGIKKEGGNGLGASGEEKRI